MVGHTKEVIFMGRGLVHIKFFKKIYTKSFTESKVVGESEYMPYKVWVNRFLEVQGGVLKINVFYQDINIAMKIEKIGEHYLKQSRHIHIGYFFVKNNIILGNI